MTDYTIAKKIAKLLQQYKIAAENEKKYSSDTAKQSVLNDSGEADRKLFLELTEKIKQKQKEFNPVKNILTLITLSYKLEIEKEIINGNFDKEQDKLTFPKLGSVKYKKEKKYRLNFSDEEKEEIIRYFIDEGKLDYLQLNEEKLIDFSKQIKEKTGKRLKGIEEYYEVDLKIT